ncbi:MAG: TSCPD domain-containing protein, partial [Deltaproteobacteria bacterium]|nr:TSCPD domain-containing protein [Deltaproteobacteria bacterium]
TRLWKDGAEVAFHLENPSIKGRPATALLEDFFQGVEKAVMALPGEMEFPQSIPLRLRLDHPEADDIAALALSGKYYPKFRFEWGFGAAEDDAGLVSEESYEKVLKMTWKKSEPSLVSIDKAYGASCYSRLGNPEAGHPGGTPALSRYEGGSLGSLNLSIVGNSVDVDWSKLRRIVRSALHFLSNLSLAGAEDQDPALAPKTASALPRLGVMGFAELLFKLGIPYDSEDAVVLAEKLFRFIHQEAEQAHPSLAGNKILDVVVEPALADLAEVSPGLSPIETLVEAGIPNALLKQIAQKRQVWSPEIEAEILEKGSVRHAESAPRPLRRLFAKREEISPEWPLKMIGSVQKYCHRPLPGSLTLGENPGLAELNAALVSALECGLMLFRIPQIASLEEEASQIETEAVETEEIATILEPIAAEASAASLVLSLEDLSAEPVETPEEEIETAEIEALPIFPEEPEAIDPPADSLAAAILGVQETSISAPGLKPRERPEVLQATSRLIQTGCGPLHVSFARDAQGPYEVRAALGSGGSCANTQTEAISRLLSLCLSTGVDQRLVYEQLRGLRCPKSAVDRGDKIHSCADGIARVFERELGFKETPAALTEDEEEITVVTDANALH